MSGLRMTWIFMFVVGLLVHASTSFATPVGYSVSSTPSRTITGGGLDWLSPSESVNMSYNDVVLDMSGGGPKYAGYRRATVVEWDVLMVDYGIDLTVGWGWDLISASQESAYDVFQVDFGLTYGYNSTRYTYGALLNGNGEQTYALVGRVADGSMRGTAYEDGLQYGDATTRNGMAGQWLVKDTTAPIPEPATVALLGIGLVGLAGAEVRRRRKKKANDKT